MNYSVKELREKLSERILGLEIDSKFLENPAFSSSVSEIDNLIGQMNMFETAEMVNVREKNGNISFEWMSTYGKKYSMSITSLSPDAFRCIRTEEKIYESGIKEKNVTEVVTSIDENGEITITSNNGSVDNADVKSGECNIVTSSEKKYYNFYGVMSKREYKNFGKSELINKTVETATINDILHMPRIDENRYVTRNLLVRDKLDTARLVIDDKSKGITYNATVPLNQEHGLKEMILNGGDIYQQDIIILPLSQLEIEAMIQKESNPKVAEGLRKYATGRETYAYSSTYDNGFVCEGVSNNQGVSR